MKEGIIAEEIVLVPTVIDACFGLGHRRVRIVGCGGDEGKQKGEEEEKGSVGKGELHVG